MKGLLYASAVLNKGWFYGAGAAALLGTVVGVILQALSQNGAPGFSAESVLMLLPLIPALILSEFLGRDLERSIKCRFTDYAMAAVSKSTVALTELAKNLLCAVISIIIASAMLLCYKLAGANISLGVFVGMWEIILLAYSIEWMIIPLTVNLKSAEHAGLLVGIILGFGIVFPVVLIDNIISGGEDFTGVFMKLFEIPDWIVLPVTAAIYVLFYVILLKRLKRGDVC